jgi:hypothetical protein
MSGEWISDGSPELSSEGNLVKCQLERSSGNVYNALWKEGEGLTAAGSQYWKLRFDNLGEHDGAFAGLTDLDKFKKGWATKGLLYGGNLSNGGALLVGEFGPRIGNGDVLGIFAVLENETLKVYFDLNEMPLGLAFDVPKTALNAAYPVVHFSGPGSATIERVGKHPTSLVRPLPTHVGITGDWELAEFKIKSEVQDTFGMNVTMRFTKEDAPGSGESYSVHLHVVNNIGFKLDRKDGKGPWTTPEARMSTMMGGTPEMMKLESTINQLTTSPSLVELSGAMLLVNNSAVEMESKWKRYSTEKQPVTQNPF